jgi:hypothetical protein
LFFSSEEDDSTDFFDLEEVREGWSKSAPAAPSVLDETRSLKHTKIQWQPEVIARFKTLRDSLSESFPDYAETFDVLFQSLEQDLNQWLGITQATPDENLEAGEEEATLDPEAEAERLSLAQPEEIEPTLPPGVAGESLNKALMELENFLEAIFVDGDFWRLMH